MILAAQQDNDRALEIFTQAQKLRPEHSWAYVGLGVVLNNKKDYQNAAQHLEKAVAMEPDSVNAQFQLGHALFNLGDIARALSCFEQVVELDPKFNPMVYKYMSSIYIKRLNQAGAARSLESYLEQFPDAPDRDKVEQILKKLGH
jgi:tetratricopeptide (TPR) repeat protein